MTEPLGRLTSYVRRFDQLVLTRHADDEAVTYQYVVTSGAHAHIGFHSKTSLQRWADERGLTLPDFPADGDWHCRPIIGSYNVAMHTDESDFYALVGPLIRSASNGEVTLGIITVDVHGRRTEHYLNPNVRTRVVFSRSWQL